MADTKTEFYIAMDGHIVAQLEFVPFVRERDHQEVILINHTLVAEHYRGRGLGRELINRVVKYARAEHRQIIPVCPFAKMILEGDNKYKDILTKGH
jgi:uncharacterized protein